MAQFQGKFFKNQEDVLRTNYFNKEWLTEDGIDDELVSFATFPIANEGVWTDEYEGGDEDDDDEEDDDYDDFSDEEEDDDLLSVDDEEDNDDD